MATSAKAKEHRFDSFLMTRISLFRVKHPPPLSHFYCQAMEFRHTNGECFRRKKEMQLSMFVIKQSIQYIFFLRGLTILVIPLVCRTR